MAEGDVVDRDAKRIGDLIALLRRGSPPSQKNSLYLEQIDARLIGQFEHRKTLLLAHILNTFRFRHSSFFQVHGLCSRGERAATAILSHGSQTPSGTPAMLVAANPLFGYAGCGELCVGRYRLSLYKEGAVLNETLPKPSKLLVFAAVVNMGVCLWLVSEVFATFVIYLDASIFWFGFVACPFLIVVTIQQYRGTFRHAPFATYFCCAMLFLAGCLTGLLSVLISVYLATYVGINDIIQFLVLWLAISAVFFGAARLNLYWGREIDAILSSPSPPTKRRGYSLQELLLFVGILAVMSGVVGRRVQNAPPFYANIPIVAEHVDISAVPFNVPTEATDISYSQSRRGKLTYEFSIDEAAFKKWVNTQVMATPDIEIERPLSEIAASDIVYVERHVNAKEITVTDGLLYSHWIKTENTEGSPDGYVQVSYDRTTGRAYYYRAQRR